MKVFRNLPNAAPRSRRQFEHARMPGEGSFLQMPSSGSKLGLASRSSVGCRFIAPGYQIVFADAEIHAVPGKLWTTTTAYLQAGSANAHAILRFRVLRQATRPA